MLQVAFTFLPSHVKSPNKAGSSGAFGIKLFEYAKSFCE